MTLRKLLSIVALTLAALGPVQAQLIPATGAQASGEYPGYPAYNAVDNNEWTIWTSGTFAPAWVDMLFTSQYQVQGVQMNAAMWPNPGYANHVVYGRTIDGGYVYMGQVGTTVFDGDWFWIPNPAPLVPYNAVTFYTPMEYTSWVGWRSLYAYGTPYVPPPPTPPSVPGPGRSGDVVGRDLNAPGLGVLGHIGVYDGSATMQVMNETTVVQAVSWTNYASVATPWPTVSTNITGHLVSSCFSSECPAWDPPYGTNSASLVSANIAIGRARAPDPADRR